MDIVDLPQPLEFEWDGHNSTKVRLRHGIIPEEAEQAFFNYLLLILDEKHSSVEQRYQLVGATNAGRVLFTAFTIRGNKIRIISARSASKKERNNYDK